MKQTHYFLLIYFLVNSHVFGQSFIPKNIDLRHITEGAIDVGDYDNDGDLDVAVTGSVSSICEENVCTGEIGYSGIFKNTNGNFSELPELGFIEAYLGDIQWADLDNDQDLDLIVTGKPTGDVSSNNHVLAVYENEGNDIFTKKNTNLVAIGFGDIELVDIDANDLIDIAITGSSDGGTVTTDIFKNLGYFEFEAMGLGLAKVAGGSEIEFIDIENDGDQDIILIGFDQSKSANKTYVYTNENNTFTISETGFPDLSYASIRVHDLNDDGYDDVILTGGAQVAPYSNIFKIFLNKVGTFEELETSQIGTLDGNIDISDFDHDGDIDILLTGFTGLSGIDADITKILKNEDGAFIPMPNEFEGSFRGGARWGDFDLDGDIDIIKIYRNPILYAQNSIPKITGINTSLSTNEETPLEIVLSQLEVIDSDNTFPDDFLLKVIDGENYSVSNNIITPDLDFYGILTVPLTVNDGIDDSQLFEISIEVFEVAVTGILDFINSSDEIKIFPNPSNEFLNVFISNDDLGPVLIELIDLNGTVIKSHFLSKNKIDLTESFELSEITKGIYFVKILAPNSESIKRVIIN